MKMIIDKLKINHFKKSSINHGGSSISDTRDSRNEPPAVELSVEYLAIEVTRILEIGAWKLAPGRWKWEPASWRSKPMSWK